jgi:hypothetical protein
MITNEGGKHWGPTAVVEMWTAWPATGSWLGYVMECAADSDRMRIDSLIMIRCVFP